LLLHSFVALFNFRLQLRIIVEVVHVVSPRCLFDL
jgi:hypothetical protein